MVNIYVQHTCQIEQYQQWVKYCKMIVTISVTTTLPTLPTTKISTTYQSSQSSTGIQNLILRKHSISQPWQINFSLIKYFQSVLKPLKSPSLFHEYQQQ